MIKLLAFLPLDGSAIIERESILFFICPPFEKQNLLRIEKKVLDKAILRHDFCVADKCFKTWDALISFLDAKVHEARLQQGQNLSEMNLGREIIDCAPPEILNRYLDKIEHELVPFHQFEQAEAVIYTMLESDNPPKMIRSRAVKLSKRITLQRKMCFDKRSELIRNDSRFESLQRSGNMHEAEELTHAIQERQSIWQFAT